MSLNRQNLNPAIGKITTLNKSGQQRQQGNGDYFVKQLLEKNREIFYNKIC